MTYIHVHTTYLLLVDSLHFRQQYIRLDHGWRWLVSSVLLPHQTGCGVRTAGRGDGIARSAAVRQIHAGGEYKQSINRCIDFKELSYISDSSSLVVGIWMIGHRVVHYEAPVLLFHPSHFQHCPLP